MLWLVITAGGWPISPGTLLAALVDGWRVAHRRRALALVAIAILISVRDAPVGTDHARLPERLRDTVKGWPDPGDAPVQYHRAHLPRLAVRGLWGGPYLADVLGMGAIARGNLLLAMSVASTFGAVVFGWLEHRGVPRLALILYGTLTVIGTYAILAACRARATATALLFVFVGLPVPIRSC
jgi:hypothetical protein